MPESAPAQPAPQPAPQPLRGRCIVVTRAGEPATALAARLRALGAEPIVCPTIATAPPDDWGPLDAALGRLDRYDWLVFTSANGVAAFAERLGVSGHALPERVRLAAVGTATATALAEALRPPALVPAEHRALRLLDALGAVAGLRVLLPVADIARPELTASLLAAGAAVETVTAYRTVPVCADAIGAVGAALRAGRIDALTFASPSAVDGLLAALDATGMAGPERHTLLEDAAICCIGPTTAAAARALGLTVTAVAREQTNAGLIAALLTSLAAPAGVA